MYKYCVNMYAIFGCAWFFWFCFAQTTASPPCGRGEEFNHDFRSCCDVESCTKGNYYNCTGCIPCPLGNFLDKPSKDPQCKPFRVCSEDEVEIFAGNRTYNRECGPTTRAETSTAAVVILPSMNMPNTDEDPLNAAIIALICGITITLALSVLIAFVFNKRRKRRCATNETPKGTESGSPILPKDPKNDSNVKQLKMDSACNEHEFVPLANIRSNSMLLTNGNPDDFQIAKVNISVNMTNLRRDMNSEGGLFWAALKEGPNEIYSYDEQKELMKRSLSDRNGRLLDKAVLSLDNLKALVYALVTSRQEHMVDLINSNLATDDIRSKSITWTQGGSPHERLRNNRAYILGNLVIDSDFWSYLRQDDIYTEEDEELCKRMIENEAKDYLIEMLLRGGSERLANFSNALRNTGNNHLYEYIFQDEFVYVPRIIPTAPMASISLKDML